MTLHLIAKDSLVYSIIASLEADLATVTEQAVGAHAAATHAESAAENKYDTFGLEAGYLAAGLARRVSEIKSNMQAFRSMSLPILSQNDVVRMGALVALDDSSSDCYFIGPGAAGLIVQNAGIAVRIITPQSPFGQSLIGKTAGDEVNVRAAGKDRVAVVTELA